MAVSQSLTLTESDVSTLNNTSKVRIVWKSTQTGESWNGYTRTAKYYVSINGGAETEYSVSYTLPQNSTVIIAQPTITVNHKSDGSGTVRVRTWMDTDISAGVVEQTKTLALKTIPRASTLDSLTSSTSTFDSPLTYKYTPKSKDYYNRCNIALNIGGEYTAVKTINLGPSSNTSQITATVTLSEDELATIYNKLTNTSNGTLRFTLRTYTSSGYTTQVGDASYKEISLSIPAVNDLTPTATLTLTPVSDFTADEAIYVKGLSKVKFVFSNAKAKYGATIAKYSFYVQGKTTEGTQNTFTSGYLTTSGTVRVNAIVYDSRERYTSWAEDINVLDYKTPSIDYLTCNTSYFTGDITYKYTPACSAFYSRCVISLGGTTIKTISHGKKALAQQTETVTFSTSELSAIYNKLPSNAEGKLKFTFRAYSNSAYSDQIGEDSYKEITLSIPEIDATQPTATMTLTPVSSLSNESLKLLYIRGRSKVKASLTGGEGKYGASIVSYKVKIGSITETSPLTSDYLTTPGDVTIKGTVTDSRGFSRTYTEKITVLDYSVPRILPVSGESEVIAARCDAAGNLNSNGTYLKIKAKREYTKLIVSGEQKNRCRIRYKYRINGGEYPDDWTTILAPEDSGDEIITGALLGGTLDVNSSYFVQVQSVDALGEKGTTEISISTEKVYMHKAGSINALGIGKYAETANTVDIADDLTVKVGGELLVKGLPAEALVSKSAGDITGSFRLASGLLVQWAKATITPTAANTPTGLRVNFPYRYSENPFVIANPLSGSPGTVVIGTSVNSIDTEGFTVYITRTTTTNTGVLWIAIGISME